MVQPLLEVSLHFASRHLGKAFDLFFDFCFAFGLEGLQKFGFLFGAAFGVLNLALNFQFFLDEFLEGVKVAAAVVRFSVFGGFRGKILDGGVTLNTKLTAQILVDSAVRIADDNR